MKLEIPEAFEDVTVDFSTEEWKMLSNREKQLHREVMVQNYEHMVAVGFNVPLEQLLFLIEKHEEVASESAQGVVTLHQKKVPDNLQSICRGTQCSKNACQMSLKKEPLNSECIKNVTGQMSAARHELIWFENGLHKCMEYDKTFSQENELNKHFQMHKVDKLSKHCDFKESITFPESFATHRQTHVGERPKNELHTSIKNSKPGKGVKEWGKRKSSLAKQKNDCLGMKHRKCATHDKSFTQNACHDRPYKCATCGKKFKKKWYLTCHEKTHTGEKPYKCATCEKSFIWKWNLASHEKIHTRETTYKCKTCNKSFQRKWKLVFHERTHTGEKPHKCATCGKGFIWKWSLTCHEKIHTGETKCETCDLSFEGKYKLLSHEKTHAEEKPYQCAKCSKYFTLKDSLIRHEKTHTGKKPYKCTICGKSFQWKNNLTYHEVTHTGDRPYKCTTCDKSFRRNWELTAHNRIHTGEKLYKCDTCDKSFQYKSRLVDHEKTHTGDRPHKCTTCGKGFTRKSLLTYHEKGHTREKPYKCAICDKRFMHKSALARHEKTHTDDKKRNIGPNGKRRYRRRAPSERTKPRKIKIQKEACSWEKKKLDMVQYISRKECCTD
ncbi:zinc finger protein 883-like [Protopterus annectens]|uniref:zinc finger protein 883-like n=1 Tax=Protopterus annectens TaxID=7888 RepID=UPI001CFBE97F|nr:zinc finger protein 883-like [Protopterus annectens]